MLRSLVTPCDVNLDETFAPRRNLSQEELEKCYAEGDMMWLDMVDVTEEEIEWLEHLLDLHPAVVADLLRDDRRPSLLVYPKYLFLSLFQPRIHLHKVEGEEIHCLISETVFVTVRKSSAKTVDEAYNRVAQNGDAWRRGVAYFLYLTMQFVIDSYYPLLDRISNQLNKFEENILTEQTEKVSQRTVYRIKQQLINMRQMVAPQREVLASAIGEERLTKTSENRDLFRHLYERLLRIYDVIDSQRDLSSNVLDLLRSQEAGRLTEAVNRLMIFSMIFLPLTFFVGLFELGFVDVPEQFVLPISGQVIFFTVIALMVISAVVMAWYFRHRGWI